MKCWYPITVPRHSNIRDKKNGLIHTMVSGRIEVPCGRCPACRRRKQNEWAFRIMEESNYSKFSAFITLTSDDDHLFYSDSGIPTLSSDRIHKFTKDLRYRYNYRYFLCGEYGDKFDRPHYHMIFFSNDDVSVEKLTEDLLKVWPDGHVKVQYPLTPGRAKYCAKYSMKQVGYDYRDVTPPFSRMSRRPGIGKQFLDNINIPLLRKLNTWCVHDSQGTPYSLPRYYSDRIYSKDEKDLHALEVEHINALRYDIVPEGDNYFRNDYYQRISTEKRFIKLLKKENYGFKFKPVISKERVGRQDDFVPDESFTSGFVSGSSCSTLE